jgi:hypothetical protein
VRGLSIRHGSKGAKGASRISFDVTSTKVTMNALEFLIWTYLFLIVLKLVLQSTLSIVLIVLSVIGKLENDGNEPAGIFPVSIITAMIVLFYTFKRLVSKRESWLSEIPRILVLAFALYFLVKLVTGNSGNSGENRGNIPFGTLRAVILALLSISILTKLRFPVYPDVELRV